MGIDEAIAVSHEALMVILKISLPPLGITLICVSALPLLHSVFAGVGRRGPR